MIYHPCLVYDDHDYDNYDEGEDDYNVLAGGGGGEGVGWETYTVNQQIYSRRGLYTTLLYIIIKVGCYSRRITDIRTRRNQIPDILQFINQYQVKSK